MGLVSWLNQEPSVNTDGLSSDENGWIFSSFLIKLSNIASLLLLIIIFWLVIAELSDIDASKLVCIFLMVDDSNDIICSPDGWLILRIPYSISSTYVMFECRNDKLFL